MPCTVDEAVPCYPSLHLWVRGMSGPITHIRTHPLFFCLFLKVYLPQSVSQFHRQPLIGHTDRGFTAPRGLAALRSGKSGDIMLLPVHYCPTSVCHFLPQYYSTTLTRTLAAP